MNFFGFLPPTNENMKKTMKKLLFKQNFLLYSNCIYYTCKKPLILLKTLKNTSFIIFFRKKYILWQYSVFFVYCLMKTMKLAEIHQKIHFFDEKKLFFVKFHIFFFLKKNKDGIT